MKTSKDNYRHFVHVFSKANIDFVGLIEDNAKNVPLQYIRIYNPLAVDYIGGVVSLNADFWPLGMQPDYTHPFFVDVNTDSQLYNVHMEGDLETLKNKFSIVKLYFDTLESFTNGKPEDQFPDTEATSSEYTRVFESAEN